MSRNVKPISPLLTSSEVAAILGVTAATVTHYARTGRIKAVRMGKPGAALRYHPADVTAYLDGLRPANE